jgi:hypothetical protein
MGFQVWQQKAWKALKGTIDGRINRRDNKGDWFYFLLILHGKVEKFGSHYIAPPLFSYHIASLRGTAWLR